jgi:protein transport protein SEC13
MATDKSKTVETGHQEMVHDAQLDYYSKLLATCSSDRSIKIFSADDPRTAIATINSHQGPVWSVQWAHPKFGVLLASASYDRTVRLHRQNNTGAWDTIKSFSHHESSVNAIKWAPHQYGLQLACASSDGTVSILTATDAAGTQWTVETIPVSGMGVNSVDWAPHGHLGQNPEGTVQRLVTGACDNTLRIFSRQGAAAQKENSWIEESSLTVHKDWVRNVAWAPTTGLPCNTIASCAEDGTVFIHSQAEAGGKWTARCLHDFEVPVWTVSWSLTGNILAVAAGTSDVTLWKENLGGAWERISQAEDATLNRHTS